MSATATDDRRPNVGDDRWLYAIGDIHGRADLLREMHRRIAADAAAHPAADKMIVYLGDYVDRGPDSRGVIDILLDAPLDGFRTVFLKGNHEAFMLAFLDGDLDAGRGWLFNGGDAALGSYDVPFRYSHGLEQTRADLAAALPASHRAFLDTLQLHHSAGDYLFVHAGIRPGVALADQDAHDLLWIREEFLDSTADHGRIVVHGHSIERAPVFRPNRIGIDTGAYATGRLTCLVLNGTERAIIQTDAED